MKRLTSLSGQRILLIPENAPEKLFSGDLRTAKSEYRTLGLHWHPDRNSDPDSQKVFQHILALYKKAKERLETNSWHGAGVLELSRNNRNFRQVPYLKIVPFELGEMYLGEKEIVFSVKRCFGDLFENAKRQIAGLSYADSAMKNEIGRCLTPKPEFYATKESLLMLIPKDKDLILLDDLRDHLGGEIAPRHVGWIQNTLHNLSCYFDYAGLVHNDIGPNTYFVSPSRHSGALLGGWWYAVRSGEKMRALPDRTMRTAPADVLRTKRADPRVDLELIRATGRELLGDPAGARLKLKKGIPSSFNGWFNGATTGDPILDYRLWKEVLRESFGPPRFIRLDATTGDIYRRAGC
jgi:hypothetical protein